MTLAVCYVQQLVEYDPLAAVAACGALHVPGLCCMVKPDSVHLQLLMVDPVLAVDGHSFEQ